MWKKAACQTMLKTLNILRAAAWVALNLLKALTILSDTTARRSAVDWEELKLYWKSEKRQDFSRGSTNLLFTSIWKTLLTAKRRLTGH